MPNGSLSLADYPAAMVRLKCSKCGRSGQYRKAKLIEKYGAAVPLPDLLHKICADCPKMDALGNDPCGVCYRVCEGSPVGQRRTAASTQGPGLVLRPVGLGLGLLLVRQDVFRRV
jgi:hypothetical protein